MRIGLKRKRDQSEGLLDLIQKYAKEISSIQNLKDLLKSLLRTFLEISGSRVGSILLFEKSIKAFVVRESMGGNPLVLQFSSQDPFLNYLGQTRTHLTKHQLLQDPSLIDIKDAGLHYMTSTHAEAVFPMQVKNRFLGVMNLGNPTVRDKFRSQLLGQLEILISLGSISVDNALLFDSLAKQNLKLSEIAKLKTQFVSTINHELSTPLNGILGLTDVLLDPSASGSLTDDQHRYIQMIRSAAEELSDLVAQILDLTRFQSKQGMLEVRRLDLGQTARQVKNEIGDLLQQKGVHLDIDLPPHASFYGDEGQIKQVFQSLLENAVKFSPENSGGEIQIAATKHGEMLKVCVSDNGIGIEEKDQEIIFEDFRQVDGDLTRNFGGTGLGLALAKKIVELHGGRIWVESRKGDGSKFYFTLPLKPGLVQVSELQSQPPESL